MAYHTPIYPAIVPSLTLTLSQRPWSVLFWLGSILIYSPFLHSLLFSLRFVNSILLRLPFSALQTICYLLAIVRKSRLWFCSTSPPLLTHLITTSFFPGFPSISVSRVQPYLFFLRTCQIALNLLLSAILHPDLLFSPPEFRRGQFLVLYFSVSTLLLFQTCLRAHPFLIISMPMTPSYISPSLLLNL
jgi:hypothetical protein